MLQPVTGEQTRESLDSTPILAPRFSSIFRTAALLVLSGVVSAGEKPSVPDLSVSALAPHNPSIQTVKPDARNWDWDHNKAIWKLSEDQRRVVMRALHAIASSKHPNAQKQPDEKPIDPLAAWKLFDAIQQLKPGEKRDTFAPESVEEVVAALQEVSDLTSIASSK